MIRTFKLGPKGTMLANAKKLHKTHVHTTTLMETEVACRRISVSIIRANTQYVRKNVPEVERLEHLTLELDLALKSCREVSVHLLQ